MKPSVLAVGEAPVLPEQNGLLSDTMRKMQKKKKNNFAY